MAIPVKVDGSKERRGKLSVLVASRKGENQQNRNRAKTGNRPSFPKALQWLMDVPTMVLSPSVSLKVP